MENIKSEGPKDGQITNKDDSVTNKGGDSSLEKGNLPTEQKKADAELVPTVTPDNDNGDPGPPAKESKDAKDSSKEEEERQRHVM